MTVTTTLFPIREPLTSSDTGLLAPRWQVYFRDLQQTLDSTPQSIATPVELTNQSAAITSTSIPSATLAPGLYRVSTYARITTADGVSSSLTVKIGFTDQTIACTLTGAAITGDTTSTVQANVWLIEIDQATPVTYATTYASNTAAKMHYKLSVTLEAVSV